MYLCCTVSKKSNESSNPHFSKQNAQLSKKKSYGTVHQLRSPAVKSRGIHASLKDLNIRSTCVISIFLSLNPDTGLFVLFYIFLILPDEIKQILSHRACNTIRNFNV